MKAVYITAPNEFSVREMPIPVPRRGEVLVRMESSPINPSDIMFLEGNYESAKPMPTIAGFEGSGTVITNGGGFMGWRLVGKRVALTATVGSGAWAEFAVVPAMSCVPLRNDVSFNSGSCFFVNPVTTMMFLDMIKSGKHRAVIQTAAGSTLAKMLARHLHDLHIPVINIVRRAEQVEALKEAGEQYVLNSSDRNFEEDLKKLALNLRATIALDCVAGEIAGAVINAMPENSILYNYGSLSNKPIEGVNSNELVFNGKRVEGLASGKWIKTKSIFTLLRLVSRIGSHLNTTFRTEVAREFTIESFMDALEFYKRNMSSGKVILKPSQKN